MSAKQEFKVFEFEFIFNNKSDYNELVVAKDIEEAKQYYMQQTNSSSLDGYLVKDLCNTLDNIYLCDENETEPDPDEEEYSEDDYCGGYKIKYTLNEYLELNQFTHIIE